MSYLDIGFNDSLIREDSSVTNNSSQIDTSDSENLIDNFSGNKIQGGLISSADGKMLVDLENGSFKITNGIVDLVQFGNLPDGAVGLLIKDNDGNILMQISGDINIIQSPNQHFQADFTKERILAKDDKNIPRVLIGKGDF